MANSYTEVTQQSWGSRLKESSRGVIIGLLLFIGAFPLLFWNEGRALHRAQTLQEGEKIVVSGNDVNKADRYLYDDKLVHVTGKARTDETLKDPMFGIEAANAIKLRRAVEMYQWEEFAHSETREQLGGSIETVTTYSHSKVWSEELIDSNNFKQPLGHHNPSYMSVNSETWNAKQVKLDDFTLSATLVEKLNNYQRLPITPEIFEQSNAQLPGQKIHLNYGSYYVGQDPNNPMVGDLRIKFEFVRPMVISVIAKQVSSNSGLSLSSYRTETGGDLELFEEGRVTAEEMFERAKTRNTIETWFFRIAGLFMMFIGLNLIFEVLKILAAVLPALGNIVGVLGSLIAMVLALIFSLITIAIAWLYYRPFLAIILLIIAGGILYLLTFLRKPQRLEEPILLPEEIVPPKQ